MFETDPPEFRARQHHQPALISKKAQPRRAAQEDRNQEERGRAGVLHRAERDQKVHCRLETNNWGNPKPD